MAEKTIERYLTGKVKSKGGRAYKFVSPNYDGMPDRIVLLPISDPADQKVVAKYLKFVELKDTGKKPTKLQFERMLELQRMGFDAYWSDSKEGIDEILA